MNELFDLDFDGSETLSREARLLLFRLLGQGIMSQNQAQEALDIYRRQKKPLREILDSMRVVDPQEYATNLAEATQSGYLGELIGTENFTWDRKLIRRFRQRDLIRNLFCPISGDEALILTLVVDLENEVIEKTINEVFPDAEVVKMVATEMQIRWLISKVFQEDQTDTFVPFDLELEGIDELSEQSLLVLLRLLTSKSITETQAQEAIQKHLHNRTPLLDILGAMGAISPRKYATNLAEVTQVGYLSELLSTDHLALNPEFIQRFNPADLIRHLFCPLSGDEELVVVLAVDPNAEVIDEIIHKVMPNADIVKMIGTERDVKRLVDQVFEKLITHKAIHELRLAKPEESASQVFTGWQILLLGALSIGLVAGLLWQPSLTATILITGVSLFYTMSIIYKLIISLMGSLSQMEVRITKEEVAAIPYRDLPIYSILVPVYKEPEVVPTLLKALSRMDYPSEKLDVLLLMEADDKETIEAARAVNPPTFFRFLLIPPSIPRTKPKACNYGVPFCRGEYVTIYDAEDIPEPDQLKKALLAFRKGAKSLVCVQAALNYFNSRENYLTRMFTLEYSYWFDYMLPGLDALSLPIPLGGTSNHFRLDRLRELGAWDPFNVTEDADLGIRASVRGYTVGIINSTTYEEANKAPRNWIRQRSRWIKGYMQTWLVHNRHPLRLLGRIGLKNWLSYQFFIGGTFLIFLINPILWAFYLIWLIANPAWIDALFGGWLFYFAAFNLLIGNMFGIYLNMIAVFRRKLFDLTPYALTNPIYWIMHSIAAYMALWQLFTKPFYWEKTKHGLTSHESDQFLSTQNITTSSTI